MFESFCFNCAKEIPSFKDFIEFKTKRDALDKIQSVRAASSGAFVGEGLVLTASHSVRIPPDIKLLKTLRSPINQIS
jgi:hypothetical protein